MTEKAQVCYSTFSSPVGQLLLTSSDGMLTRLSMALSQGKPAPSPEPHWRRDDRALKLARQQLEAFFAGELQAFDLTLCMAGTPFQKQVWQGLLTIPYGTTISYAQLAARIGRPGASRAVGAANGRNPIGIIVPCHRVIGADGTLTGYGGGLDRKEWLISHEASVVARDGRRDAPPSIQKLQPRKGANKLKQLA
jgi:methylated-DNA-[protein]-cysteine S-methyltransferase